MKRFLIAAAVGLIAGLVFVRLSRQPLLSEELPEANGLEDAAVRP
jgi:hypothetical protein